LETAHPEEASVRSALDGEQAHALSFVDVDRPRCDLVGILARDRLAAEVSHDLGMGVQRRVVREVVQPERAQHEPVRSPDNGAVPTRHRDKSTTERRLRAGHLHNKCTPT
jgi:hypothetical protein